MTTTAELAMMIEKLTELEQAEFQAWVKWRMQTDAPEHYGIANRPIGVAWKGLSRGDQERVAAAFAAYEVERREGWGHDPATGGSAATCRSLARPTAGSGCGAGETQPADAQPSGSYVLSG